MNGMNGKTFKYGAETFLFLAEVAYAGPSFAATGVDLGWLGKIDLTWEFCVGFLSIVLIALAVKNLKGKQRRSGIVFGAGAAGVLGVSKLYLRWRIARRARVALLKPRIGP
jgi:hypothetical protein